MPCIHFFFLFYLFSEISNCYLNFRLETLELNLLGCSGVVGSIQRLLQHFPTDNIVLNWNILHGMDVSESICTISRAIHFYFSVDCVYMWCQMGKLKRRIRPSDITINIGKSAPIPECPIPGERLCA